ncbi:hypothetical protein NMG60_11017739 [Bertholletia excelsa]
MHCSLVFIASTKSSPFFLAIFMTRQISKPGIAIPRLEKQKQKNENENENENEKQKTHIPFGLCFYPNPKLYARLTKQNQNKTQ